MTKTAMKAYMDKDDRLIIIIDQPGAGLTELVKSFLGGCIPAVQHLDTPVPMPTPDIDTTGLQEIDSQRQFTKPAKFIRKQESASPILDDKATNPPQVSLAEDKHEERVPSETKKEKEITIKPNNKLPIEHNTQLVECMTVFELQDYLRSRSNDEKLVAILAETVHTPLDFVLHTKSERELRAIAQKLAN